MEVSGAVGQGQEAAGRQGIPQPGDNAGRIIAVRDEVLDRDQEQRDRPGEVEE